MRLFAAYLGLCALVPAAGASAQAAAEREPAAPDAAPLRAAALEFMTALVDGDRDQCLDRVLPADRDDWHDLDSVLRQNAARKAVVGAVREKLGDAAAASLPGGGSDRDTLEKALNAYEVRKRPYREGWILAYSPRPGAARAADLPRELIIVGTTDGFRVARPEGPRVPPWRVRQLSDRISRVVAATERVTVAVRAGETASVADVTAALRQGIQDALSQWQRETDVSLQNACKTFATQFDQVVKLQFDAQPVQELAFDAEGKRLAIGLINTPRSLHLLDVAAGKAAAIDISDDRVERHVEALAFAGDRLAVAGAGFDAAPVRAAREAGQAPDFSPGTVSDGKLRLIDPAGGRVVSVLEGHDGYTTDATFRDGVLYTVGSDNTARAWRVGGEAALLWERRFTQAGSPYGIAVVGDRVAVGSAGGVLPVFDRATGRPHGSVVVPSGVTDAVAAAAAGDLAVAGMGHLRIIDLSVLPPPPPKGDDAGYTTFPDLPARVLTEDWLGFGRVNDLAVSRDADLMASGDGTVRPASAAPARATGVRIWRASDGQWLGVFAMPSAATSVALSADGRLLAVGDMQGRVTVFRLPHDLKPVEPEPADRKQ